MVYYKVQEASFYLSTAAYCFGLAFLLMDTTAVKKLFFGIWMLRMTVS